MSLRIVSVLYKNRDTIVDFLDSLNTYIEFPAEIVLWDNNDDKKYVDSYLNEHPQYKHKVIICGGKGNLGFSAAANQASNFKSDTLPSGILFLNPDGFLASPLNIKIFEEIKNMQAIVGFRVFNEATKTARQSSARNFPGYTTALFGREGYVTRIWPKNPWSQKFLKGDIDPNKSHAVDWVSGCALFAPVKIWLKIGGFDERYFLYVEDVDLGRKALEQKIPVLYYPNVDVVHSIQGSSGGHSLWPDIYHHQGMWKYYLKWTGLTKYVFGPFVALGILMRFLLRRVF